MIYLSAGFGALVALGTFFLPALVAAQNSTITAAATFYFEETETQFSVNVANDSSDVFIYLTSPAYSWVGFGFGAKMENSLMFVAYPNAKGDNVTISPRLGSKNSEPSYASNIDVEVLAGTQINDSMLILNARCRNCRDWSSGSLDVKSEAQPMIYAFGPGYSLMSNSPSANLKRHFNYGQFTMNMLAATGTGGVPAQSSASNGVKATQVLTRDHDRANRAHAVLGCLALFVLWPLSVLVAGFLKNIRYHIGVSVVIIAFLIVSYALGISTSAQFNRSKTYNTPHQIMAFIALAPLLLMTLLPIPSLSNLHAKLPSLHQPLSSLTFLTLVLTGGLGLALSQQTRPIILIYTAISLFVAVFTASIQFCIRRRGSAHARATQGQRFGTHDNDSQVMLKTMEERRTDSAASLGQPPGYSTTYGVPYSNNPSREFGDHGQAPRPGQHGVYGGGAMPGPQYLLNMHPGIPVQPGRM